MVDHPMLKVEGWNEIFIPIWVYGDGGAFQDRDSLLSIALGGVLGMGPTDDLFLLITSFVESCLAKLNHGDREETWVVLWARICWNLEILEIPLVC